MEGDCCRVRSLVLYGRYSRLAQYLGFIIKLQKVFGEVEVNERAVITY